MTRKIHKHNSREKVADIKSPVEIPAWITHLAPLVVILFSGLFCYANSFQVPFVLDDVTSILTNPLVKNFDFRLKSRIIGDLSFALNYQLGGVEPGGYHLVNLLLHLLNGGLIYALVQLIFRTPAIKGIREGGNSQGAFVPNAIGFGAALLFVTHPLQTQAVTYLAQRVALLAAFFYLGALLCYGWSRISSRRLPAAVLLGLSLLLAVASVLAKENGVTVPFTIILFELTFFRGALYRRLTPLSWYLLPLLVAPFMMLGRIGLSADLLGEISRLTAESGAPSRMTYLLTQFPVIVTYLRLFFFPAGQNLDHDIQLRTRLFDPVVISSGILLAALLFAGFRLWRSADHSTDATGPFKALGAFAIGWFFITISLESSLIPIRDVMFEHRMYLPSVGLVIGISSAGCLWAMRLAVNDQGRAMTGFITAMVLLGILLGSGTFLRNRVWRTEVTLWQDVVNKSPNKARSFGSLGHAQQRRGNPEEAIQSYLTAVRLDPSDHIARNNLGTIYMSRKNPEGALEQFREALKSRPSSGTTHYNMGLAYTMLERFGEAETSYREALKLGAERDQVLNNLGIALFRQGNGMEALKSFREAVKLNPGNREARENLTALEKGINETKGR